MATLLRTRILYCFKFHRLGDPSTEHSETRSFAAARGRPRPAHPGGTRWVPPARARLEGDPLCLKGSYRGLRAPGPRASTPVQGSTPARHPARPPRPEPRTPPPSLAPPHAPPLSCVIGRAAPPPPPIGPRGAPHLRAAVRGARLSRGGEVALEPPPSARPVASCPAAASAPSARPERDMAERSLPPGWR